MGTDDSLRSRSGGPALPWLLVVLLLVMVGAAGYYGYPHYRQMQEQLTAQASANQQAQGRLNELTTANEALDAKVKALEVVKGSLEASVQAKDGELAALKATTDQLQQKLQTEIASGDIQVSQQGQRIQVDLVDKILFDSGKADISKRGQEVLMKLGDVLAGVEDKLIQVSGHTDDAPIVRELVQKFPTNWELSAARAVTVVRFLSESAKVKGTKLVASGFGQFHPVASNNNREGRARNRRIEILLAPEVEMKRASVTASAKPQKDAGAR